MDTQETFDVLIVGSGAAGLTLALNLADHCSVGVISKNELHEGSTYYAQGGISAVLDSEDSFHSHIEDTLISGADLCDEEIVRFTVENGPKSIAWLESLGVEFTLEENDDGTMEPHLTREGGHSHRRVIHSADATGRAVETTLVDRVRQHKNVTLLENHIAVDLVTRRKLGLSGNDSIVGAYVFSIKEDLTKTFRARFVALATGGASKVYLYTSNPDGSTGDGIAMGWRAGCRVANMEFMQFHPTCLYHPNAKSSLISEAVRGEGGMLFNGANHRFMEDYDERMELAPRDIVARAIDDQIKRRGEPSVFLDISHKPADFVLEHFPNIHKTCMEFGYDMTKEKIPVVPAAHYTCGGILTDKHGATDISGLYAIGETSCTGLHGANRMASNSLLECFVFGYSAAQDIISKLDNTSECLEIPEWDESLVTDSDEEVVVAHNWDELRRFMWDYVGIVRTDKRLQRAKHRVDLLLNEINDYYGNFRVNSDLLELRNLAQVADLIICCALARKESRGLHYTLDYPDMLETPENTVLTPTVVKPHPGMRNLSNN